MGIYAKIICDSISPLGIRLTSIEVQFPRFILSQILMHRMWSRSCESLRARPVASKVAEVETDPYRPTFAKNQKGMVAGAELGRAEQVVAQSAWSDAHRACVKAAKELAEIGVAKQWANRLLEPFAYQKVLVTATDFANFFRLRCADDAQPEIQELAVCMRNAMEQSEPKELWWGEWHLPYFSLHRKPEQTVQMAEDAVTYSLRDISAARCARVSYTTHDGKRDLEADLKLAATLIESGHSNPFEHVATPAADRQRYSNLKGWVSYRRVLEDEGRLPHPEG